MKKQTENSILTVTKEIQDQLATCDRKTTHKIDSIEETVRRYKSEPLLNSYIRLASDNDLIEIDNALSIAISNAESIALRLKKVQRAMKTIKSK